MKFSKNKLSEFTLEDFEKGLVLAGLVSPSTVKELNERDQLEQYEKQLSEENRRIYFKRTVLAAEIVNQLHSEPTFGRVKFQKLVYLCEHSASMDLQDRYSKQAAGPFDNKFMHSIENEFERQKWFQVKKTFEKGMNLTKYLPLSNCHQYKSYYVSYYGGISDRIDSIIELFRKSKTDVAEIAATLFYCQLELIENREPLTNDSLLRLFYEWSDKKKRFGETQVLNVWEWMKSKGLIRI